MRIWGDSFSALEVDKHSSISYIYTERQMLGPRVSIKISDDRVDNMINVQSIEFYTGSQEEVLPGFSSDFPYIASRAKLDRYVERSVPWHWHRTVELFYVESGSVEYYTPGGKIQFPKGSGGLVNANVIHMTKAMPQTEETIQLLHIFDVSLLAGERGSRIENRYITPVAMAPTAAFISERECYRIFREYLHIAPAEYMRSYRMQKACQMLAEGQESVTEISHACGLGSSSYFGKVFYESMHCTPSEYRRKWQNSDRKGQR